MSTLACYIIHPLMGRYQEALVRSTYQDMILHITTVTVD